MIRTYIYEVTLSIAIERFSFREYQQVVFYVLYHLSYNNHFMDIGWIRTTDTVIINEVTTRFATESMGGKGSITEAA